jgi:hypothetical protein
MYQFLCSGYNLRLVSFPNDRKRIPPIALDEILLIGVCGIKAKPVKARIDESLCEFHVHFEVTGDALPVLDHVVSHDRLVRGQLYFIQKFTNNILDQKVAIQINNQIQRSKEKLRQDFREGKKSFEEKSRR